jgi:hypothetical protein
LWLNLSVFPPFFGSLLSDLRAPLRRHFLGASWAAFQSAALPKANGCRIFALLFWRRLPVLNLACCYIDNEFGELSRIAGALFKRRSAGHACHAFDYGTVESGLLA